MKALVTGATGFIGGYLVRTLVERGYEVRILVRRESDDLSNLPLQVVSGDISDQGSVRAATRGVDVVFHLAAIRDRWGIPYRDYYRVNVEGTQHLLEAAADQGCRFVYCSSVGVMGHPGCLQIDENSPYATGDGKYNYSHTKALADEMTLDYAAQRRLWATVVRPVITYGPGDTWGMVTRLLDLLAHGRFLPVGNGTNYLHLAYISDVINGFLLAAASGRANGRAYIIAGPAPITLNNLVEKLCNMLGVLPPRWHVPAHLARAAGRVFESLYAFKQRMGVRAFGDVPFITQDKVDTLAINRGYSTTRAETELGFRPCVDYDEGLPLAVHWWRSQSQGW